MAGTHSNFHQRLAASIVVFFSILLIMTLMHITLTLMVRRWLVPLPQSHGKCAKRAPNMTATRRAFFLLFSIHKTWEQYSVPGIGPQLGHDFHGLVVRAVPYRKKGWNVLITCSFWFGIGMKNTTLVLLVAIETRSTRKIITMARPL